MSRCFSYPPPGYSGYNEALIESIKLQREREREKAKAERKKEKREKKEKRREKKERREEKKEKSKAKANQSDEKAPKVEKSWADLKEDFNKRKQCEAEQLEKSGLTEEHGQSVGLHNPSYSSDSTQNSNKRKRSSVIDGSSSNHGNIIRIRLPLQKHKEPVASASKHRLCSTSGKADLPPQHIQHRIEVTPKARQEVSCSITKELECSTSGRNEIPVQDKTKIAFSSKINEIPVQDEAQIALSSKINETPGQVEAQIALSSKINEVPVQDKAQIASSSNSRASKKMQRLTSVYEDLVKYWMILPALESEPGLDDNQDWLFGNNRHVEKRCRTSSSDISSYRGSDALIPSAQFLPEADIYALPYTLYF